MKDRIQKYIDYKNINAGEFAVILEVQRSNISHILNGRNKPSAAFIEKMLIAFPDLNARWLITGQGDMIEPNDKTDEVEPPTRPLQKEVEFPEGNNKSASPVNLAESNTAHSLPPNIMGENVDSVLLLFSDGTFTTFKKR